MESNKRTYENIDDYINSFSGEVKNRLELLRQTIKNVAPHAEEVISYQMPAFKYHGVLVYFAAHKNHIGFYATPTGHKAFSKELSTYKEGKGSVQFPMDKPLPLELISKMVKFRAEENLNKAEAKKQSKTNSIHYHKDGSIWAKGKMEQGSPDGYWEWYRKDGTILRSGHFEKGKQIGAWITYDRKGQVYKVTKMK